MSLEHPNLPYVGQIVDYYPDNETRLAALVTEVLPSDNSFVRPNVNLAIFDPKAEIMQGEDIEPVNPEETDEENDLEGKWAFAHEFNLRQDDTTQEQEQENPQGTKTNLHVGSVSFNT